MRNGEIGFEGHEKQSQGEGCFQEICEELGGTGVPDSLFPVTGFPAWTEGTDGVKEGPR